MKRYIYNGKTYTTEQELRQAVWKAERKVFGKLNSADSGVIVEEFQPEFAEEEMSKRLRLKRDTLLRSCDYYVMPDYPSNEEDLVAVKKYRQELRDITNQEHFPFDVVFPKVPDVLK